MIIHILTLCDLLVQSVTNNSFLFDLYVSVCPKEIQKYCFQTILQDMRQLTFVDSPPPPSDIHICQASGLTY